MAVVAVGDLLGLIRCRAIAVKNANGAGPGRAVCRCTAGAVTLQLKGV